MHAKITTAFLFTTAFFFGSATHASAVEFQPRELFRIPFGTARDQLGAQTTKSNFSFPREFTMDEAGRFYVYDTYKHRIVRYSSHGTYEIGFSYPASAQQTFAHADSRDNLWLLISDPNRGVYYGVYDTRGKKLRDAIFSQFDRFRLHIGDDYTLRVILSSSKRPASQQIFQFEEASLLMKKEAIPVPPENHHQVRKSDRRYFIDQVPGKESAESTSNRITDESRRTIAVIHGQVLYVTASGDVYTRVGDRTIYVYDVEGSLRGKVTLTGLPSSWATLRFDPQGNIYQLDGIPDPANRYTPTMLGLRMVVWQRQ